MRTRIVILTSILALAGLAACGDDGNGDGGETTPSEITGVITEVESTGLTEVQGFTMRAGEETYEILIDPNTNLGFPPAHLNEHRVSGEPVKVEIDDRSGDLYAVSVEDG